jgi:hypothetical protein
MTGYIRKVLLIDLADWRRVVRALREQQGADPEMRQPSFSAYAREALMERVDRDLGDEAAPAEDTEPETEDVGDEYL